MLTEQVYRNKYKKYKKKYLELKNHKCSNECLFSHSSQGSNYLWLEKLGHGRVLKIEFEEPIDSGNWRLYTDKWWAVHCKAVDHKPENLVEAHVKAFIDPEKRFARKRFTFEDGTITEPTVEFYELERDYFKDKTICE